MKKSFAGILFALAVLVGRAQTTEPTLKVGDPAPQLQTGQWIQGEPVTSFERGKAYLIEFWATRCRPCRDSIPRLNELHKQYKDRGLVVIGQDYMEPDEPLVPTYVRKLGDQMTYRIALDDRKESQKGKMAETWMVGRETIRTSFLVDTNGVIAWIGHPMALKDEVIEQVLSGTFDIPKAAANYKAELKTRFELERFRTLIAKKDYPAAYQLVSNLSDQNRDNAILQNEIAWRIATDPAITNRNLELAEKIATRANQAAREQDAGILDTLAHIEFMLGKVEAAIAFQEKAVNLSQGPERAEFQKTLESYKGNGLFRVK
jgi:thiol-disulfide isomerase/thioredoxin